MAQSPHGRQGPLDSFRVLDLTDLTGAYGSKLLAGFGADVTKVEPHAGDPMRHKPPFAGDIDDGERSLLFLYRNSGKRGITLDYTHPAGRDILLRLAATADVLYESFEPFGQDGPMAHWKTSPIVSFAMSGAMTMSGWPGKEPCDAPHPMAYDSAATYATVAVMMALWSRHTTDRGQPLTSPSRKRASAASIPGPYRPTLTAAWALSRRWRHGPVSSPPSTSETTALSA